MIFKVFTDGGSRGNPGKSACAIVVYDDAGNLRKKCGKYLGIHTNNEAEYLGVIEALKYLKTLPDIEKVNFFLDSLLVVSQLKGEWKIKEARLREFILDIKVLEQEINKPITYTHVPRAKNAVADALLNETLDNQKQV